MSKEKLQTKQKILAAAQRMFFENGYDKTSINAIIEEVGVAKGTFYHHFNSKEELMEELVKGFTLEVEKGIMAALGEKINAIDKLNAVARRGGEIKAEKIEFIRIFCEFMVNSANSRMAGRIMEMSDQISRPVYEKIIIQGEKEGVFNSGDPEIAAEIIIAIGQGLQKSMIPFMLKENTDESDLEAMMRYIKEYERAIERILGAPENSIKLGEKESMAVFLKK